jgi:gliding-associated putative ABC transporter substrate-binding component GldG
VPVNINFEILRYPPDASKFNKKYMPLAVMLEGVFSSLYENRMTTEMTDGMSKLGLTFQEKSKPTKMLVVSDGDIAVNTIDPATGQPRPLGYNRYMNQMFANKDFLMNAVEYLLDNNGIIESRTRDVKLRLLDGERIKEEAGFWQLINIVLPLLFLAVFGFIFNYRRKKKYAN